MSTGITHQSNQTDTRTSTMHMRKYPSKAVATSMQHKAATMTTQDLRSRKPGLYHSVSFQCVGG
jgi:hypothetical protein